MILRSNDGNRLFGMEVDQWPRQWRAAGEVLLGLPLFRGMAPKVPVELRRADGEAAGWTLSRGFALPTPALHEGERTLAIEMPSEHVLERHLMLPQLAPAEMAQAVQLEVASISPFAADQTVYGYAAGQIDAGVQRVDIAITSRQLVNDVLLAQGLESSSPPEVWVLRTEGRGIRPIVMQGYGETVRESRVRTALQQRLALLVLALVLLVALLMTPAFLMRGKAQQAQQAFDALQKQAAPQITQRDALMQQVELLRAVGERAEQQLAMPPVLDMLTRTVPDGAWLTSIRVEGTKLILNGQADDAAVLVQRLATQKGVHDVRLASPATRGAGAAKETFIIELNLDGRQYGPVRGAEASS